MSGAPESRPYRLSNDKTEADFNCSCPQGVSGAILDELVSGRPTLHEVGRFDHAERSPMHFRGRVPIVGNNGRLAPERSVAGAGRMAGCVEARIVALAGRIQSVGGRKALAPLAGATIAAVKQLLARHDIPQAALRAHRCLGSPARIEFVRRSTRLRSRTAQSPRDRIMWSGVRGRARTGGARCVDARR